MKIIKSGEQMILDATQQELVKMKEDLTLDNPAYINMKKYGRGQFSRIPPKLLFYRKVGNTLLLPRGYKIPFDYKVMEDQRNNIEVEYPEIKIDLRETQQEAFNSWDKNTDRGMIVLQTGKGKSILGCYMAYAKRQRTLVVVQKNDLVDGWNKDIEMCFGISKKEVGLIKAKDRRIGEQFTLCTIQTLSRMDEEERAKYYDMFGMIIVDEVHHSPADSYSIMRNFRSKYLIGLTATDMRTDGLEQVQYWMFGQVAYRGQEDINDADILPYSVVLRQSEITYVPKPVYTYKGKEISIEKAEQLTGEGVKGVTKKPFNIHELNKVIKEDQSFNRLVAKDIVAEYRNKKSCVAFFSLKEHIKDMKDLLVNYYRIPENQIQLYYGDSKIPDDVMKERAESKEVLITLATYAKATEGTNVKAWERAFLVTSVNNEKNVIQAVGRIRRRKEGKKDAIVYDYSHPYIKVLNRHLITRKRAYKQTNATFTNLNKKAKLAPFIKIPNRK